MAFFPPSPLVTTGWLANRLGDPGLVILDTSWYLPSTGRDARAEYRTAHIPGAVNFDLDAASDTNSALPHMLPNEAEFGRYVGGLGVQNDSTIVVYDGSGGNLSAARVWWMFRAFGHDRVALLDGGFGKWQAEGRPVQSGEVVRAPKAFHAHFDRQRVRDLDDVRRALEIGDVQVVDLRSAGRFAGSDPEPRPGLVSGHMPGALNLPYTELVDGDGTMLSDEALRAKVVIAGIQLGRPLIATCGSGTSACNLLLALHRLGHDDTFLYDGSWTEWAGRGMPIEKGGA